ncbi:hypothetical protein B0H10DRAFT_980345 [Mycena sp. CBHHK59/15]|nr:hypothetical protein B0H10DRAFT_980345 [Mycena sp. CBHHK59/15]
MEWCARVLVYYIYVLPFSSSVNFILDVIAVCPEWLALPAPPSRVPYLISAPRCSLFPVGFHHVSVPSCLPASIPRLSSAFAFSPVPYSFLDTHLAHFLHTLPSLRDHRSIVSYRPYVFPIPETPARSLPSSMRHHPFHFGSSSLFPILPLLPFLPPFIVFSRYPRTKPLADTRPQAAHHLRTRGIAAGRSSREIDAFGACAYARLVSYRSPHRLLWSNGPCHFQPAHPPGPALSGASLTSVPLSAFRAPRHRCLP